MSKLKDKHIVSGRIAFLSDDILRESRLCRTDATFSGNHDNSVEGDHSFLILKTDIVTSKCVCVPLLSGTSKNEKYLPLDNEMKSNFPRESGDKISYFYSDQFWEIPFQVIKDASVIDQSPNDYRREYAIGNDVEIKRILNYFEEEGEPRRPLRLVEPRANQNEDA